MLRCSRRSSALPNQISRCHFSSHSTLRQNRPPNAPKQFPDTKAIRDRPELYKNNTIVRRYEKHKDTPRQIADLGRMVSELDKRMVDPRRELRGIQRTLAAVMAQNNQEQANLLLPAVKRQQDVIDEIAAERNAIDEEMSALALSLPNLTSPSTPTNGQPRLIKHINYDYKNPPVAKQGADHSEIGQKLGILDFESASTTTGWGFYYFKDEAVLLEQALILYAMSIALKYGWRAVTPPSLVYSHIADSCGFQPRDANDEQQIWQVAQADGDALKPKRSLAATAEIPLAAMYADQNIEEKRLPIKLVGSSRCYRAEAGARGVDTKGLYRVHEFTKVEMFAWSDSPTSTDLTEPTAGPASANIFNEMVNIQIDILQSLGLPCRVIEMPSNDLGASAFRKIDIEAFFPSRINRDQGWGEVTSASMCTDYQTRRLNTRIKDPDGTKKRFPHTSNGTAMAVPRVMACILENGWNPATRCVDIPEVLRPFMSGIEKIGPTKK